VNADINVVAFAALSFVEVNAMDPLFDARLPVGHYWIAAASSGFARPDSWRSWADAIIRRLTVPTVWLIDLALAKNVDDVYAALSTKRDEEVVAKGDYISIGNAKLGYLYLRFERGDYALCEFLQVAGGEADGGDGGLECEIVYALLNDVEEAIRRKQPEEHFEAQARRLFAPFTIIASQQWATIESILAD
jgi:hypothetical protein